MLAKRTVFILSASSDIGRDLALLYARAGDDVVGTYRRRETAAALMDRPGVELMHCDVSRPESVRAMAAEYAALDRPWDVLISCVGTMDPIGPFLDTDFDAWEQSVIVNSTAQLRALHALYPYRRPGAVVHAAFFAGGGTNNPFTNYSAYCVSKIMLIKMCELLDDEAPDLNAFIIGPGFLPTKIHQQTFDNPAGAGQNYEKTRDFYRSTGPGTTSQDVYQCINWCIESGRTVIGGRNLSTVHDPWRDDGVELAARLRADPNQFKLRRFRGDGV